MLLYVLGFFCTLSTTIIIDSPCSCHRGIKKYSASGFKKLLLYNLWEDITDLKLPPWYFSP